MKHIVMKQWKEGGIFINLIYYIALQASIWDFFDLSESF